MVMGALRPGWCEHGCGGGSAGAVGKSEVGLTAGFYAGFYGGHWKPRGRVEGTVFTG